ncbi:MAG TPA: ATP-binding protein [Segeticoccus sp.]|uniref:ATP-binding protein n=1 Tax=Segeticoccus sp. TaxID=2706531 RepID=UPI002D7F88B4|nr:ATP-binding protein [Segeticoccus sp.]HET8599227.1 ATP-binding protein [Segeticoccus sp.]
MRADDLRPLDLFDGLTTDQLGELAAAGTDVPIEPGVELFHEGEHADYWWLLVEGDIELRRHVGREDVEVGRLDVPGRWAGGFRAWNDHGVYLATGIGAKPGRVLQVPAPALRELLNAWFPFGVHLVAGLHGTAQSIESTARQHASLIMLGTLAAGLAHELNNPAAAAASAVNAVEETSRALLTSLEGLAGEDISAAQFRALTGLRREIEASAGPRDPLELADLEEALTSWLEDHDVDRPWELASRLAAHGADVDWCERAAGELDDRALPWGLSWVASTLSMSALLGEVKESTRRISELVAAVRSHSQMDRGTIQLTEVTEGLDSSLVMLGHKLRDGVTVVRDYSPDVPRIEAFPGELNQVWANLIDNAVDAMDRSGTLRVTTRADGQHVVVEVIDTGPGMPPEVVARAFEAFYTTKDVGKGSGLGLDIARRIVEERHGGSISIDSRPGQTVLRVRLPVHSTWRSSPESTS